MIGGSSHNNNQAKKRMKTFTAKLRNIEQAIVKEAFKGKDGNVYIGAMMVDTGSVHCILNKSVLPLIDESCVIEGKTMNIHSVQRKGVKCQGISFNYIIYELVVGQGIRWTYSDATEYLIVNIGVELLHKFWGRQSGI